MAEELYEINMKVLPEDEKPREKLLKYGSGALKNAELLAIVLNTGYKGEGVLELSGRIIKEYGSKAITFERNVARMMETLGVPKVKACQIVACFELGRRFFKEDPSKTPIIRSPDDAYKYLEDMRKLKKEELRGLYLNTKNKLIHDEVISIGTLTANLVHPREAFLPAVEYSAAGLIVAHNHPSGDPTPSEDDIKVTKQLIDAGRIMNIDLLDHIIVGDGRFISIKEKSLKIWQR